MKKVLSILLVLAMVFALAGCGGEQESEEPVAKVVMITDTGGLGDGSFNDLAYAGCTKAGEDLNVEVKILESATADDYAPNIAAAVEEGADLVVCVGFMLGAAVQEAAAQYPDQMFVIIDNTDVDNANVAGLYFNEQEGSFLVGIAAAMVSETGTIGFVGGMQQPTIEKFQYGFEAGVKAAGVETPVLIAYTQSFGDAALGKECALAQYQQNADVIYHAAGGCGIGVIQAAGEQDKWVIGVDSDQSVLDPEHVLCSMGKRVDNAVYSAIKSVVEGTFTGDDVCYKVADDGIIVYDGGENLPAEVAEAVEAWRAKIAAGDFEVPYDKATFDAFEVPTL